MQTIREQLKIGEINIYYFPNVISQIKRTCLQPQSIILSNIITAQYRDILS